ncbi:MAG: sigma-70 family RNA polymerase sigma factor [Candidatus Poribacteria bacterium]|nr:sigma-70 family RNA polymerase sigma factor [Candidatus Poribacteria bacterium]
MSPTIMFPQPTTQRPVHATTLSDPTLRKQIDRLVRRVCVKAGRAELIEDAMQEAWVACAELLDKYDPETGVPLISFLRPRVYWTVLHYCRDNSGAFSIPERMWRSRRAEGKDDLNSAIYTVSLNQSDDPTEESNDIRLTQIPDSEQVGGVYFGSMMRDDSIWRRLECSQLNALIDRLEPNERTVVQQFGEGFGCADIAREMGVSRQRIHQVLHRAFDKIRVWWEQPTAA